MKNNCEIKKEIYKKTVSKKRELVSVGYICQNSTENECREAIKGIIDEVYLAHLWNITWLGASKQLICTWNSGELEEIYTIKTL